MHKETYIINMFTLSLHNIFLLELFKINLNHLVVMVLQV